MKQFAIYFIPNNTDFYKKGSELIGYDIVNESCFKVSKNKYVAFAQKLNAKSREYGFHLTLTDAVDINENKIEKAVRRSKFIFNFPIFRNIRVEQNKIGLMPNANVLAIQYKYNLKLFLLHLLLILFVQRLGNRSYYTNHIDTFCIFRKIKTRLFLSPYIINDFLPHITLVHQFSGQQKEMLKHLNSIFKTDGYLHIKRITLVVRENEEFNFKILKILGVGDISNDM